MSFTTTATLVEIAVGAAPVALLILARAVRGSGTIARPPVPPQLPITLQSDIRDNIAFTVGLLLFVLLSACAIAVATLIMFPTLFGYVFTGLWTVFWASLLLAMARSVIRDYRNPEIVVISREGLSRTEGETLRKWRWSEIDHAEVIAHWGMGLSGVMVRLFFKQGSNDPMEFPATLRPSLADMKPRDVVDLINSMTKQSR